MTRAGYLPSFAILALLAACAGPPSTQPVDAGSGPTPVLPEPESKPIPLVNIAPAKGWSSDQKPTAAAGRSVASYADGLDHPRWLYVHEQKNAGAGTASANRITLLRDADGDGRAEVRPSTAAVRCSLPTTSAIGSGA